MHKVQRLELSSIKAQAGVLLYSIRKYGKSKIKARFDLLGSDFDTSKCSFYFYGVDIRLTDSENDNRYKAYDVHI